jgi:hypothetical protein
MHYGFENPSARWVALGRDPGTRGPMMAEGRERCDTAVARGGD